MKNFKVKNAQKIQKMSSRFNKMKVNCKIVMTNKYFLNSFREYLKVLINIQIISQHKYLRIHQTSKHPFVPNKLIINNKTTISNK